MGRKEKIPGDIKIRAVDDYLSGKNSMINLCRELDVDISSFKKWVMKCKAYGEVGLLHSSKNAVYSVELKLAAVQDYLAGEGSFHDICIKYKISSDRVLQNWIMKYNGHETFKSQNLGDKHMTEGRKTSYEERVEIVSFCIANNDNYQIAAEKYQVSYQQVYTWTKKYKEKGPESLIDQRGKRRNPETMTETEKLVAQVKLLQAENQRLLLENGFLKKLKEVERRRTGKTNIQLLRNTTKKPDSQ